MSFAETLARIEALDVDAACASATSADVRRVLTRDRLSEADLLALLSPAAEPLLEAVARRAHGLTLQHFGRQVLLYTPLYLSNYCENRCRYCGFHAGTAIARQQLDPEELRREAEAIAATGLRHLLILTGDARKKAPPAYVADCARILREYFDSVAIEIYACTREEYAQLASAGVDAMTIYQETYERPLYAYLHPAGPKADFDFRLDAPERACRAAMRAVNIGSLLGLAPWRREAFLTAVHARWLQDRYPGVEISVSLPRMRPHAGGYPPAHPVADAALAQILLAHRLYNPRCGVTMSTREPAALRENLLPLGVTRMSAGVNTAVGGRTADDERTGQFEIADERSVAQIASALEVKGYQPVYKDWQEF